MKLEWLRRLAVANRPQDLVKALEHVAGSIVNGEALYLPYDWDNYCLKMPGSNGKVARVGLDKETVAGECALLGEVVSAGKERLAYPGHDQGWNHTLAIPVRRFGCMAGVLLIGVTGDGWPQHDDALVELAEAYALISDNVADLDQHRQSMIQFQELAVAAVEGQPGGYSGHIAAVCGLTADLADYLDLSSQSRRRLWNAALYHDVGKLLLGGHSALEVERRHTEVGADFLTSTGQLAELAPLVLTHHEHYDGTGFPNQLRGDQMTVEQYVLSLAEGFEEYLALNHHLGFSTKVGIFFQEKSRCHHPDVVDALAGLVDSGRLDRLKTQT